MLPRFSLATPTVADCPFAVVGGAEERLVLLPLLLPQPATANAASTGTVALARNVVDLVRVMLAPFVEWVDGSLQRACGRMAALASRSHGVRSLVVLPGPHTRGSVGLAKPGWRNGRTSPARADRNTPLLWQIDGARGR